MSEEKVEEKVEPNTNFHLTLTPEMNERFETIMKYYGCESNVETFRRLITDEHNRLFSGAVQ